MAVDGYVFLPGTEGANSLVSLLKNNSAAQPEVSAYSQFWILNGMTILLFDDQVECLNFFSHALAVVPNIIILLTLSRDT